MKKTLMMHLGAMIGTAAMVAGLLVATAPEAESRSGVGNDRTGDTVNNQGMMVSSSQVSLTAPNDDIHQPANAQSGSAPISNNKYGTTRSNMRKDVKHGQ